jgi:hypothetical protein
MPLEAMRTNVREFLTLYATTGPTKWNYARWPGRIVSVSSIEKRFGSWRQAVMQARCPDGMDHPAGREQRDTV